MTNEIKTWQDIRNSYLKQVEKAISKVKTPRKKEILCDVEAHLDQKFSELADDQKTWENFQAIITDMGPAQEYAELLSDEPKRINAKKLTITIVLVIAVIGIATIFTPYCMVAYSQLFGKRMIDNVDIPFETDNKVIGIWKSVDFVENIDDFEPGKKKYTDSNFLTSLEFKRGGILTVKLDNDNPRGYKREWTKGVVINRDSKTASKYFIKNMGEDSYVFYEWKSGDYKFRHQKPHFYVLKKVEQKIDITVKDLKLQPHKNVKGAYYLKASIENNSSHYCEPFTLHFYINDPENKTSNNHGGGPIKAGEVFNSASSTFSLKDGLNTFTTVVDVKKEINDPDRSNNRKTITVMAKDEQIAVSMEEQKDELLKKGIVYVEADKGQGFNYPYFLFIPGDVDKSKNTFIYVEPNNTGTSSDDEQFHVDKALKLIERSYPNRIARNLKVPLLVPTFPRPRTNWRAYTHSLDIDTLEINHGKLKRIDIQLIAMIEDARGRLKDKGYQTSSKVFMHGFSASAKFTNRFAFLHPEMVQAAACGGVNGMAALPLEERNGHQLPFPIGVSGIEMFTGKRFADSTKLPPQYIYMGSFDRNDTLPSRDAWNKDEASIIKKALAKKMMPDRWQITQDLYSKHYPSSQCVTYSGIGHTVKNEMMNDIVKFFRANSGDEFVKIKPYEYSSVEYRYIEEAKINGLYWKGDKRLPEAIRKDNNNFSFFIGIENWIETQKYNQLNDLRDNAGFDFILKADGHEDIIISEKNSGGTRTSRDGVDNFQLFYVKLSTEQLNKMQPNVQYTLYPVNKSKKHYWKVNDDVVLVRP